MVFVGYSAIYSIFIFIENACAKFAYSGQRVNDDDDSDSERGHSVCVDLWSKLSEHVHFVLSVGLHRILIQISETS